MVLCKWLDWTRKICSLFNLFSLNKYSRLHISPSPPKLLALEHFNWSKNSPVFSHLILSSSAPHRPKQGFIRTSGAVIGKLLC